MVNVPNFLIAGAGESGTSWLSACLMQHPEVYLPKIMRPEPHYFYKDFEYEKGIDYYLGKYFKSVPSTAKAIGERSSNYHFGPEVAERIHQDFPSIKLIFMLREPVDRAYSNWRFTVQNGLEPYSFKKAIELEDSGKRIETDPLLQQVKPHAYLGRGRYAEQLERFSALFSKDQILILNSDAVKKNEPQALQKVCRFLGIDHDFKFQSVGSFPTSSVKSVHLQVLLRKVYGSNFDHALELTRLQSHGLHLNPFFWMMKLNQTFDHPKMDEDIRSWLDAYYLNENQKLDRYVEWNPMEWKQFSY